MKERVVALVIAIAIALHGDGVEERGEGCFVWR